jgi:hypothetical protein
MGQMAVLNFGIGQVIVYREVERGRILDAKPVVVVRDDDEQTLLWLPLGTETRQPELIHHMPGTPRVWRDDNWELVGGVWRWAELLIVLEPDAPRATWLRWDAAGRFAGWYVNLQSPAVRTPIGFDFLDHQLDILVAPDRSWTWKDEDELVAAVEQGRLRDDDAREIRRQATRAVHDIEAAAPPFDSRHLSWRPDADWPHPSLPTGWDATFSA